MKKKPQAKKPFKLNAKAKLGRGRMEPVALIDTMQDQENWDAFQKQIADMGEDDRKEMYEYFVNCSDNLQIENEQLADSLFGEDADGAEDGDKFKATFEALNMDEKDRLVNALYECGLIAENEDDE